MVPESSPTRSDRIDSAAKTYLSAIGASAIYIAAVKGRPVCVGVARDLDKALRHLQKTIDPAAQLGWIAWGMSYDALLQIAKAPELLLIERGGIKAQLPLAQVVGLVQLKAQQLGVTLTPHARALERAEVYSAYLDSALAELQRNGTFAAFNAAYKQHRQASARNRESVVPFWAVMQELRAVVIRALVADPKTGCLRARCFPKSARHCHRFTKAKLQHMQRPKFKRH